MAISSLRSELIGPLGLSRRVWLGVVLSLGAGRALGAVSSTLPAARSLRDELTLALRGNQPLVVMVNLHGCAFCKTVRQHYLIPLREQQGLPVVQLDMRSGAAVQNFNATLLTHDALVRAWNVTIAPTVLFFGHGAAEVAPRLLGASGDYYGVLLEQRLTQARSALKRP